MKELNEEQLDMIEDESASIPSDQAEFLKSLEFEEQQENLDPEQDKTEEAAVEKQLAMDTQTAQMTATMGLSMIEFSLKRVIHADFEFTPSTKEYAIENLGPILIKYGALLPDWLASYDAEIKAAMAVGKLVSEGVDTAKTLKARDAAEEVDETKKDKERVRVAA